MDDTQLIDSFLRDRSPAAFEALTKRYVNLVYSAAVRQVGDRATAEDVTQAVFVLLMKKAASLQGRPNLSGWLLAATHYAAKDATRSERRRKRHEQKAAAMTQKTSSMSANALEPKSEWQNVAPLLDIAMVKLKEPYREAVVLRYFEKNTYEEVAAALKISETAARQRVSRGVQQLRDILSRSGAVLSVDVLKVLIAKHALAPAPPAVTAAVVAAKGTAASARVMALAHATAMAMVPLGVRVAVITFASVLLGAAAVGGALWLRSPRHQSESLAAADPNVSADRSVAKSASHMMGAVRGVVLNPDGTPGEGADVYLARNNAAATMHGPQRSAAVMRVQAGPDGAFEFPATTGATAIVARSSRGGVQMLLGDVGSTGRVQLVPWGRIEGTVTFDRKPGAKREVRLSRSGGSWQEWQRWYVVHDTTTPTDAAGHFRFPQVGVLTPPTSEWLVRVADSNRDTEYTMAVPVTQGQLVTVDIGSGGRNIVGRLVGRAPGEKITVMLSTENLPPTTQPTSAPSLPANTPRTVVVTCPLDEDGRFHIEGMTPDHYALWFRHKDGPSFMPKVVDVPAGTSAEVIDLGEFDASAFSIRPMQTRGQP